MAKTDPLDPSVPAGSEDPKLGDDRIRELARAVAELLNVDHYMGTDGGSGTGYNEDAAGEHSKVTLRTASAPTVEASKGYVYAKDVSGKAELFYKDEDGNEIQLTAAGILNSCNLTGNQTVAGVKTFSGQPSLQAGLTAAAALISTLATGTAPLTVASTTKVSNLNADKVDGYDITAYSGASGSYNFPGGLQVRFGEETSSTDDEQTFNFDSAFSNSCEALIITRKGDNITIPLGYSSKSTTGFVVNRSNSIDSSHEFSYIALGY